MCISTQSTAAPPSPLRRTLAAVLALPAFDGQAIAVRVGEQLTRRQLAALWALAGSTDALDRLTLDTFNAYPAELSVACAAWLIAALGAVEVTR